MALPMAFINSNIQMVHVPNKKNERWFHFFSNICKEWLSFHTAGLPRALVTKLNSANMYVYVTMFQCWWPHFCWTSRPAVKVMMK